MANGTCVRWTEDFEIKFLQRLMDCGGNIREVCRNLNVTHASVYAHKHASESFAAQLDEAKLIGAHILEDVSLDDALLGTPEPLYVKGELVLDKEGQPVVVRKISWTSRIFLLKGAFPDKYRDRYAHELSGPGGGPIASRAEVRIYLPDNGRKPQEDIPAAPVEARTP
jgi:hypothetical protein